MQHTILLPQDIAREGREFLLERGYILKDGSGTTQEDLIRDVADCDAMLLRTAKVNEAVLQAGKKLKIVARHGAGYDNVDTGAAARLGIWVTNAPHATTETVAEFTLGLILALTKSILPCANALGAGDFAHFKQTHRGVDLAGKTLGILGFGRIGSAVARKAHYGLDMKIITCLRGTKPDDFPDYVEVVSREELFSRSDILSLHLPVTPSTRGAVGNRELALMKPTAYLINVARGDVVDQPALTAALREKHIAGAALDVFSPEPPGPDEPLLHMDNVLPTPHMASNTEECGVRMSLHSAGEIHRVLSGEPPRWPVNKPAFE